MMSWASAMEHVTFGLALCKSTTSARKVCAQNAQIPALGYRAVQEKEETVQKPHSPSTGIKKAWSLWG